MRIGIYIEPGGDAVGGSEFCAAILAEAFASEHDVEIIHHKRKLTSHTLESVFDTDLAGTRLRYLEPSALPSFYGIHNPLKRLRAAKGWQAELSSPYQLFIAFTHNVPPFCHAKVGLLVVLFPFFEREEDTIFRNAPGSLGKYVKRAYYQLEWHARMRSYSVRTSISEFTRLWTKKRWHIDTAILNPPAGKVVQHTSNKTTTILSVGRFSTHAHTKKQMEMIQTFGRLASARAAGWGYRCVGGLSELAEDMAFFEQVTAAAAANGASVGASLSRVELDTLFATASIFWHATGYGVDENTRPELMEHYGISTVEAMAGGCVPIVINKGGQREIVQHGVNGYLWDTLDELAEFTTRLTEDEGLRHRMSAAALVRAAQLSRSAFVANTRRLIAPFLD